MKTSGITTFLHSIVVLSFIFFVGLSLSVDNMVTLEAFEGAPGGDGNAGPGGEGGETNTMVGRFFYDRNLNGTWDKTTEELIFSSENNGNGFGTGTACSLYTGLKMTLPGIYAVIYGVKYPPNGCTLMDLSSSSSTTFGSPAYYTKFIADGATTITTEFPSGWSCSTTSPGCARNVTIGVNAYALPIGIKPNPTICNGPITINNWTDNTIIASDKPNPTKIRKVHIEELRYWINVRRVDAGLPTFSWTDPTLTENNTKIRKVHIAELRTAISDVYTKCGQSKPSWIDDPIIASDQSNPTKIRRIHIIQLRDRAEKAK